MTFANKILEHQKAMLNLLVDNFGSQAGLAKALGVSDQVVCNWVRRGRISATMAEKAQDVTAGKFDKRELRPDVRKWYNEKGR